MQRKEVQIVLIWNNDNNNNNVCGTIVKAYTIFAGSFTVSACNGFQNIMEDQYALKPAFWQTSLFRLQNVKLMRTKYNNLLLMLSNVGSLEMINILNDYFCNHIYGNYFMPVLNLTKVVLLRKKLWHVDLVDLFLHRATYTN